MDVLPIENGDFQLLSYLPRVRYTMSQLVSHINMSIYMCLYIVVHISITLISIDFYRCPIHFSSTVYTLIPYYDIPIV